MTIRCVPTATLVRTVPFEGKPYRISVEKFHPEAEPDEDSPADDEREEEDARSVHSVRSGVPSVQPLVYSVPSTHSTHSIHSPVPFIVDQGRWEGLLKRLGELETHHEKTKGLALRHQMQLETLGKRHSLQLTQHKARTADLQRGINWLKRVTVVLSIGLTGAWAWMLSQHQDELIQTFYS